MSASGRVIVRAGGDGFSRRGDVWAAFMTANCTLYLPTTSRYWKGSVAPSSTRRPAALTSASTTRAFQTPLWIGARTALARLVIHDPDSSVRLQRVRKMPKQPDAVGLVFHFS